MKIIEAVKENIAAMNAAGIPLPDVSRYEVKEFGDLEIISRKSLKGRKGYVYTVFQTAKGAVAFWPLSGMGPSLGWLRKRKEKSCPKKK